MSDKKLTISTILDTSAFDASVKKMQQDLSKINAPTSQMYNDAQTASRMKNMGYGGMAAGPSQEAFKKASESSRQQMEFRLKQEMQVGEAARKNSEARQRELRYLKDAQSRVVEGSERELKIKESIVQKEKELIQLRTQAAASTNNQNQILTSLQQNTNQAAAVASGNVPPSGTPAPTPGGAPGLDMLKLLGGAAGVGAIITKGIGAALAVYRGYGEAPLNTSINQGSAMSGTFGSELRNAYAGRSGIESAYMPEKQVALAQAQANLANRQMHDKASIAGIIGGAGFTGGIAGAALGGVPGAAVGALAGTAVGVGSIATSPRLRARMLSSVSPTYQHEYESMNAKEFADNYSSGLEAEKQRNPLKSMALEDYQGRYQRNLDFQRSSGLNYDSFHGKGGFRDQVINSGFTDDMGMNMGSAILGAGGSTHGTSAATSVVGLQMQRGYGMNNSAGVLGQLSSGMGSAEATRDATIKLLSEGTRLGLDGSQFRAENQKFSEAAAEVISRSGASTGEGVDSVLDKFGGFFTDKTTKGVEAGKSAFETYQNLTSSTSGANGAMRLSGMLRDEKLGSLSGTDRAALSALPSTQLTPDNMTVQDIAGRNNMTPDDVVSRMGKVNRSSVHRLARADELQETLSNYALSPNARDKAFGEYRTLSGLENPELNDDPRRLTEFAQGSLRAGFAKNRSQYAEGTAAKLANKDTGLAEDRTIQQNAEGSRLMLENFQKLGPAIGASAEAIGKFNAVLEKNVEILMKLPPEERAPYMTKIFGSQFGPTNQTQGGKPSK